MTDLDSRLEGFRNRISEYGNKRGLAAIADDFLKGIHAKLMDGIPEEYGTIPEKEAFVRRQQEYKDAIRQKKNWIADWETIRLEKELLMAEMDKYRTDEATKRDTIKAHL